MKYVLMLGIIAVCLCPIQGQETYLFNPESLPAVAGDENGMTLAIPGANASQLNVDGGTGVGLPYLLSDGPGTTSILEPELIESFEVYPNPARNGTKLFIQVESKIADEMRLEIFSSDGRSKHTGSLIHVVASVPIRWDVSLVDYSPGPYFITIKNSAGQVVGNSTVIVH